MFTIDSEAKITAHTNVPGADDPSTTEVIGWFATSAQLREIIQAKPGEWAVKLWNQLPGVTPIHTPPGEPTAKFRNKQTAVERIWGKLCELYPDAVNPEDMPKIKGRNHAIAKKRANSVKTTDSGIQENRVRHRGTANRGSRSAASTQTAKNGRKSAWAEELTEALRKQFHPGDSFELQDVYKLIPQFQRRHKENHHIAARLRTTLAQDLRGAGIVKTTAKGKYRMA